MPYQTIDGWQGVEGLGANLIESVQAAAERYLPKAKAALQAYKGVNAEQDSGTPMQVPDPAIVPQTQPEPSFIEKYGLVLAAAGAALLFFSNRR